jgi:hypothetical protein
VALAELAVLRNLVLTETVVALVLRLPLPVVGLVGLLDSVPVALAAFAEQSIPLVSPAHAAVVAPVALGLRPTKPVELVALDLSRLICTHD